MGFNYQHKMTVAAHRGESYNFYANTMEAFEAARLVGAGMVDTDVRMTVDGELVRMHNERVFHTNGAPGEATQ